MGLLKEFRPVASTQGRRKICKSRGVLSRNICFYSGNINIERRGGGKRGVELGTYPSAPRFRRPLPLIYVCASLISFFFHLFFSLCLGDFAVASKSPLLNWTFCKSSPMGVWCRLVMADAKVRKSTQKYAKVFNLQKLLSEQIHCI